MQDPTHGLYSTVADCDIAALFDLIQDMNEPPQNTFNLMLQCFTERLTTQEDQATLISLIMTFSRRVTDYLTEIEFEISYL
jgi:hypothetical protein